MFRKLEYVVCAYLMTAKMRAKVQNDTYLYFWLRNGKIFDDVTLLKDMFGISGCRK